MGYTKEFCVSMCRPIWSTPPPVLRSLEANKDHRCLGHQPRSRLSTGVLPFLLGGKGAGGLGATKAGGDNNFALVDRNGYESTSVFTIFECIQAKKNTDARVPIPDPLILHFPLVEQKMPLHPC